MFLNKLQLNNLRCFSDKELIFASKIILIEGNNGSGKTTIIEALYYLSYLRSFRTGITQEMIRFDNNSFFIKAYLSQELGQANNKEASTQTLQVGFSPTKRLVKLNDTSISSFKELTHNYRVIVITEEDLNIITGSPETRRGFVDQYIYLHNPDWAIEMRLYKRILDNRNALLKASSFDLKGYQIWTKQLIERSEAIRQMRLQALAEIESAINQHLVQSFDSLFEFRLVYKSRQWQEGLQSREQFMERTLFGAHLDDYNIQLSSQSSRKYASRGQQKLIAILMKVVQVELLKKDFLGAILFLLDDFVTDLDDQKIAILFDILVNLKAQLIFTAPNMPLPHKNLLLNRGAQIITI